MSDLDKILKNIKINEKSQNNTNIKDTHLSFDNLEDNFFEDIIKDDYPDKPKVLRSFFQKKYKIKPEIDPNEPIDLVYSYVDFSDETYRNNLKQYSTDVEKNNDNFFNRYINFNEFFVSLTLTKKNLPWIRNIFIVTPTPKILIKRFSQDKKIKIIHDNDFLPETLLKPTFKSTVIESFLYLIPELSNVFLYGCDDMMISSPMTREEWFYQEIPFITLEYREMSDSFKKMEKPAWVDVVNANAFFHKYFREFPQRIHNHQITILRKDVCKITHKIYEKQILLNAKHRFREPKKHGVHFILLQHLVGLKLGFYKDIVNEKKRLMPSSGFYAYNFRKPWFRFNILRNQETKFFCLNELNEIYFSYFLYSAFNIIEKHPAKDITFVYQKEQTLKYQIPTFENLIRKYLKININSIPLDQIEQNDNTLFIVLCQENENIKNNFFYLKINPNKFQYLIPDILFFTNRNFKRLIPKIKYQKFNVDKKYEDNNKLFHINFSEKQIQSFEKTFNIPLLAK